jgi:hypothetical protein
LAEDIPGWADIGRVRRTPAGIGWLRGTPAGGTSWDSGVAVDHTMIGDSYATNTGIKDAFRLPGIATGPPRQVDMASGVATIAEAAQETGDGTETAANNLCNGSIARVVSITRAMLTEAALRGRSCTARCCSDRGLDTRTFRGRSLVRRLPCRHSNPRAESTSPLPCRSIEW